jgi:hypothetical protein
MSGAREDNIKIELKIRAWGRTGLFHSEQRQVTACTETSGSSERRECLHIGSPKSILLCRQVGS